METMEIVLLVVGAAVFVASFLLPAGKKSEIVTDEKVVKEEIRSLVADQMKEIKTQVDDTVEEAVQYAMEKTERSLERISNEKIMAVNEYSDTVLAEINKNHQEVMFLYDMLNDKHISLKNTASKVEKTAKEAENIAKEAHEVSQVAKETTAKAQQVLPVFRALQPETVIPAEPEAEPEKEKPATKKKSAQSSKRGTQSSQKKKASENKTEQVQFNNNETILAMYATGKSKVEIAKELGLGVGEVSLVIDLFKG